MSLMIEKENVHGPNPLESPSAKMLLVLLRPVALALLASAGDS